MATEARALRTANAELDALHVAQEAAVALVSVVDRFSIESDEYETVTGRQKLAAAILATMAFRTARACVLVIAAGYVPEAFGLKRRVSEARWRMEAILNDHSGESAKQFIESRSSPPRKLAGKTGSLEVWDAYSWGTHVDLRVGPSFTRIMGPDGVTTGLPVASSRQAETANHMLVELAHELRNMAGTVAKVLRDGELGPRKLVEELDAEIAEKTAHWYGSNRQPDEGGADTTNHAS